MSSSQILGTKWFDSVPLLLRLGAGAHNISNPSPTGKAKRIAKAGSGKGKRGSRLELREC